MNKKSELLEISSIFRSEKALEDSTHLQTEDGYNMSLIYDLLDMIVHRQVFFLTYIHVIYIKIV